MILTQHDLKALNRPPVKMSKYNRFITSMNRTLKTYNRRAFTISGVAAECISTSDSIPQTAIYKQMIRRAQTLVEEGMLEVVREGSPGVAGVFRNTEKAVFMYNREAQAPVA